MRGRKYAMLDCPCGTVKHRMCGAVMDPVTGEATTNAPQRTSKRHSRYNWTRRAQSVPGRRKIRLGNHTRKFNCSYCDVKAVNHQERRSDKKAGQYDFRVTHWVRKSHLGREASH